MATKYHSDAVLDELSGSRETGWSVPVEVFAGADRNFEPSLEDLEAARTERTKAIIVNTPNNPTGAVWNPETVKAIGEWAVEHHVWVISDEIYEHLNYDGCKNHVYRRCSA